MKRNEMDARFQWDLTQIYPNEAAWEAAMQTASEAVDALASVPGTLGTSKEAFKAGLDAIYAASLKMETPYIYAFLKKTEDGSDSRSQEMEAKATSLAVKFGAATAFLSPEILSIPAEKLLQQGLVTARKTENGQWYAITTDPEPEMAESEQMQEMHL